MEEGENIKDLNEVLNPTKNIYQKLFKIQEEVLGLGKDKQAFGYEYVTGTKILGVIKPLMKREKLILKQEVLEIENSRQDYNTKKGAKSEILSKVMMRFTWVDVETGERDENLFGANGQNGFDKGVGSALTYAERYFLLKYFHIATDEDDIETLVDEEIIAPTIDETLKKTKLTSKGLYFLKDNPDKIPEALKTREMTTDQRTYLTSLIKK